MWSKVREFGFDRCTLPTMVANTSVMLRPLSLNVDPTYKKNIPIIFRTFTIFICLCYFYVYAFSVVWFVFWKCTETGDVISAMIMFSLGISSEISTVKWMYMFVHQDSLRDMMEKYLIHDSKPEHSARFTNNLLKVLRRVKRRAVIFWIMIIGNGVVYTSKPLLMSGRHIMEDTEFLYGLEPLYDSPNYEIAYFLTLGGVIFTCYGTANISGFFIVVTGYIEAQMLGLSEELVNIWDDAQDYYNKKYVTSSYSTESEEVEELKNMEDMDSLYGLEPIHKSPNYEIGYFITFGACIFTVYGTASISWFFIIVTGYIEAQMLSLSEELMNVWDDALDCYHKNYNITATSIGAESEGVTAQKSLILNKYVKERLRNIIDTHQSNINFLQHIEYVFRSAIAIEFGLLVVSLISEFLGGLENTYLLMPFALVQVTMDCITGQKLLDSSDVFLQAVYDSKWENFDVTNQKTVMMILLNSQREMGISAAGLVKLSFICLMAVLRMIYSTYTALRTAVEH